MDHRSVSTYKEATCKLPPLSPVRVVRNAPPGTGYSLPKHTVAKPKTVRFPSLFRVRPVEEPCPAERPKRRHLELPELDPKDLRLGDCISQSDGRRVYKALRVSTGQIIAVKYLSKSHLQLSDLSEYCRILARVNKLALAGSVKYFGVLLDHNAVAICSEFVSEGGLAQNLDPEAHRSLLRKRLVKLSNSLREFHQDGLAHSNLKLSNILVDCHGNIKLTDWRLCKGSKEHAISKDRRDLREVVMALAKQLGIQKQSAKLQKQNERFESFDELLDEFIPNIYCEGHQMPILPELDSEDTLDPREIQKQQQTLSTQQREQTESH